MKKKMSYSILLLSITLLTACSNQESTPSLEDIEDVVIEEDVKKKSNKEKKDNNTTTKESFKPKEQSDKDKLSDTEKETVIVQDSKTPKLTATLAEKIAIDTLKEIKEYDKVSNILSIEKMPQEMLSINTDVVKLKEVKLKSKEEVFGVSFAMINNGVPYTRIVYIEQRSNQAYALGTLSLSSN